MRTILPHPSQKDTQIPTPGPQSSQSETPNDECSSPLNNIPTAVTRDNDKCAILQGSEKENIQPICEEPQPENVNDCNNENLTDANEDLKVQYINCFHQ